MAQEIVAASRLVELRSGAELFRAGKTPAYVHFLESGLASIVTSFEEGHTVESSLVGSESFPEKLYLLGPGRPNQKCFMQMPGKAYRLQYSVFQSHFLQNREAGLLLMRHAQADLFTSMQLSGCNRVHLTETRLARWLLMAADRVGNELGLTQEFLSYMLGCRRSTVTILAGVLQTAGMISYRRGRISILNRAQLEEAACECYRLCRRFREEIVNPLDRPV